MKVPVGVERLLADGLTISTKLLHCSLPVEGVKQRLGGVENGGRGGVPFGVLSVKKAFDVCFSQCRVWTVDSLTREI